MRLQFAGGDATCCAYCRQERWWTARWWHLTRMVGPICVGYGVGMR
jgi:hypothetical protein